MGLVIGIDASRNRSGGAIAHLLGILQKGAPASYDIEQIHVWTYKELADALPVKPWLVKHTPPALNRSLLWQLLWQFFSLSKEARKAHCDILYSTDAATICQFSPLVVMSQDMLEYEQGMMKHFGLSWARLRLIALLLVQNRAFRFANGVIFLSQYAADSVQKKTGPLNQTAIIPHGVSDDFKNVRIINSWRHVGERAIRCLYVSHIEIYKNQWVVVQAIDSLRKRGHNITLTLIGAANKRALDLLNKQLAISDPDHKFVFQESFIPHHQLPARLAEANLFLFASSCENLPVTLIEGMSIGLPIACSNRGPMPEILKDGGTFFDPEDANSIANAVEKLILDQDLRLSVAKKAKELSSQYSWQRCADETFAFIVETYNDLKPIRCS